MRFLRFVPGAGITIAVLASGGTPGLAMSVRPAVVVNSCTWTQVADPVPVGAGETHTTLMGMGHAAADDIWLSPGYTRQGAAHWDGRKWTGMRLGTPPVSISAVSSRDAWGGGPISHWDGTRWSSAPGAPAGAYPSVSARPGSAWFAPNGGNPDAPVAHWDGSQLTTYKLPSETAPLVISAIADVATNDAWAVGWAENAGVVADHWDGATWTRIPAPAPGNYIDRTWAVTALSSSDVWMVGYAENIQGTQPTVLGLIEHWNGSAWSVSLTSADAQFWSISAVSPTDIWAGGETANGPAAFHWDGVTWTAANPPAAASGSEAISAIAASANGDVWAAGNDTYNPSPNPPSSANAVLYHRTCGPPPPPVAAATRGRDGAVWTHRDPAGGWQSLGGQTVAAPAVVSRKVTSADAHLYIVTGIDHQLWVRSDNQAWQLLGTSSCVDNPAVTEVTDAGGTHLDVACKAADGSLWYGTAADSGTALPNIPGWTGLGGKLADGPAVATVGGVLTFFVNGVDGVTYTRTLTSGFSPTSWRCVGHPAAATSSTGYTYFACQGADHALWHARNMGHGWDAVTSAGGVAVDGPGIVTSSSDATFYIQGQDGALWERTYTGAYATEFTTDSGVLTSGVGASG
jgi:hypothetical protein